MKTLIISDVHANVVALEAILAREPDCDRIYCAGDLVDWGPFPREVIAWMQAHRVTCVRGNHDDEIIKRFRSGEAAKTHASYQTGGETNWADHNANVLTGADVAYLEALPLALTVTIDGESYGLTHLYNDYQEIVSLAAFADFSRSRFPTPAGTDGVTRMIFGHTHRQSIRQFADDRLWLNPGSVSYRRLDDPDQTAHYALIMDGRISLRRLAYDLSPLRTALASVRLTREASRSQQFFSERP